MGWKAAWVDALSARSTALSVTLREVRDVP